MGIKAILKKSPFIVKGYESYKVMVMNILSRTSRKWATQYHYRISTGRKLNLKEPKEMYDILNYIKVYRFGDRQIQCADKYRVREYVQEKNCPEILNELYGVYKHEEEIDWDSLPKAFVLKANNAYNRNIICRDKSKLEVETVRKTLKEWRQTPFGYQTAEFHYTKIPFRIICEKYIESLRKLPIDYKFICIKGMPLFVYVLINRGEAEEAFTLDMDWKEVVYSPFRKEIGGSLCPDKPSSFELMKKYAALLSKEFDFVRVDLYDSEPYPILGELTFTPNALVGHDLDIENLEGMKDEVDLIKKMLLEGSALEGDYHE